MWNAPVTGVECPWLCLRMFLSSASARGRKPPLIVTQNLPLVSDPYFTHGSLRQHSTVTDHSLHHILLKSEWFTRPPSLSGLQCALLDRLVGFSSSAFNLVVDFLPIPWPLLIGYPRPDYILLVLPVFGCIKLRSPMPKAASLSEPAKQLQLLPLPSSLLLPHLFSALLLGSGQLPLVGERESGEPPCSKPRTPSPRPRP